MLPVETIVPSLLVYTTSAVALFGLGWCVWKREQRSMAVDGKSIPFFCPEIILSIILFSLLAGLRYNTGFDHPEYLRQYMFCQEGHNLFRDYEPLFAWVTKTMARLGIHFSIYFSLWGALQIGFLYYGLHDRKHLLPWVGLLLMCGSFFFYFMNSIRQGVIVSLFVSILPLLTRKRYIAFVLIVLLASLFHWSAFLMLFYALFIKLDLGRIKSYWLLPVYVLFIILGEYPMWLSSFAAPFQNLFADSVYHERFMKVVNCDFRNVSWGASRILFILINLILIISDSHFRKYFASDNLHRIGFTLFFIGICGTAMLVNTNVLFLRIFDYCHIFSLILSAYLLSYLWQSRKYVWFSLFLTTACCYVYVGLFKSLFYKEVSSLVYEFYFLK